MSASMSLCCSASSCDSPRNGVGATLHPASPAVSPSDLGPCSRALAPPEPFAGHSAEQVRDHANRLLTAARNGNTTDAAGLLAGLDMREARALLDAVEGKAGNAPLALAAMHGHVDMCTLLLSHGANVHALNNSRETAVDLSIQHRHKEVTKVLVAAGGEEFDDGEEFIDL